MEVVGAVAWMVLFDLVWIFIHLGFKCAVAPFLASSGAGKCQYLGMRITSSGSRVIFWAGRVGC